jgi:hypothetical protein
MTSNSNNSHNSLSNIKDYPPISIHKSSLEIQTKYFSTFKEKLDNKHHLLMNLNKDKKDKKNKQTQKKKIKTLKKHQKRISLNSIVFHML